MPFENRSASTHRARLAAQSCLLFGLGFLLPSASVDGNEGESHPSGSLPAVVSVSPASLIFSAAGPRALVPASQTVTVTLAGVTSGPIYIKLTIDGLVVVSAAKVGIVDKTQAQATINPGIPGNLGTGMHTSVVTISVCTTGPQCDGPQLPGSPQTIGVTYRVGAPGVGEPEPRALWHSRGISYSLTTSETTITTASLL